MSTRLKGPWVTRLVEKLHDTIKEKDKEIERLRKENEFMCTLFAKTFVLTAHGYENNQHVVYIEKEVYEEIMNLQQALKEGE